MPLIQEADPSISFLPSSDKCPYVHSSSYHADHWVLKPLTLSDSKVIALVYFQQSEYAIHLHPTDKRGYRCIVRLIDNSRMISTLDRNYTSFERIGLALTMAMMTEAYSRVVPIAQNAVAGNNAHSFDSKTGSVQLGNSEEPIFLHGHVYGRGNPKENYIEDVALDGPAPGLIFDMRARSSHELGNDTKVSWKHDDVNKVVRRLKREIEHLYPIYQTQGLTVITENRFIDVYFVRHGQTDWNVERKLQGHTDTPLNELGKMQATALQEKFAHVSFTKVFASDLARAYVTAELILGPNTSTVIQISPLLRERCFWCMGSTTQYRFTSVFERKL